MANITVTYSFVNGTVADASEVNTNFSDILSGLSDGTKDLSVSAITAAGNVTFNANTQMGNATSDTITTTARLASDLDPNTDNARDFGAAGLAYKAIYSYDFFASLGAVGTPSYSFNNAGTLDPDTGMWSSAANTINFSAGGTEILELDGTSIDTTVPLTVTGQINGTAVIRLADGSASAPAYSFTSDTNSGMYSSAADEVSISAGSSQKLVISTTGVGIGVSPGAGLTFENSTSGEHAGSIKSTSLANGESVYWRGDGTGNSARRFSQFGIHYNSSGTTNAPCGFIMLQTTDDASNYLWVDDSDQLRISTTATHRGTTSGTVVGTQTSDERTKSNIKPIKHGLDAILKLEPIEFDQFGSHRLGLSAQKTKTIVPEVVIDTDQKLDIDPEGPNKLVMEYVQLIPVLVKAVQDIVKKVA